MANKTSGDDRRPAEEMKAALIRAMSDGMQISEALGFIGRSQGWYADQRKHDRVFAQRVDRIRKLLTSGARGTAVPDFPEFCEEYLGMRLWPHQLNMFDVLEGREPRFSYPSMTYTLGSAGDRRILINIPPNHSKTFTVSIAYVLWRILRDKDLSVLLISKTQAFAAKILWAIKQRLTSPRYAELQLAFGPVGGFKETADQWAANKVYLWGEERDSGSKDPTLEAVGIGGQIYGNRAGLILIDDAIVLSNASAWEFQQDWIRQEVASRIGPDDQLVIVGTRVAPVDLYRELRNPEHYHDNEVPWTYLGMPAVLDYAEKPEHWVTLWPVSEQPFSDRDQPFDGMNYHRWTGERLAKVRNEVGPRRWSLVYQQADVSEDGTFDPFCVRASTDFSRHVGPIRPGVTSGVPAAVALYIICSMDPAVVGNTAACAYAVDRISGQRWLADVRILPGPNPRQIRELIEEMTERFQPQEWVVEANAYQLALVQDENINRFLASRGVVMRPHYTTGGSRGKTDEKYGVASLSTLFGTVGRINQSMKVTHNGDNLLSLPSPVNSAGVKKLLDELTEWSPTATSKQRVGRDDAVMALWFAELRAREIVNVAKRTSFAVKNRFLSDRDRSRRYTINLSDIAGARELDPNAVYL